MLLEESFLKYIGENNLSYYFGAEHKKIQEKNIIQEESESEENDNAKKRGSDYVAASEVFCRVNTDTKEDKGKELFVKDVSIFNKKSSKNNNNAKKKGVSESSVLTI